MVFLGLSEWWGAAPDPSYGQIAQCITITTVILGAPIATYSALLELFGGCNCTNKDIAATVAFLVGAGVVRLTANATFRLYVNVYGKPDASKNEVSSYAV
jgi:hypothetical protein